MKKYILPIFLALMMTVSTFGQIDNFECFFIKTQDSTETESTNSTKYAPFGGSVTPKGDLRVLVIYAGFEHYIDCADCFVQDWTDGQNSLPFHLIENPNSVKDYYQNFSDFDTYANDPGVKNLSKYYHEMSKGQFRVVCEPFRDDDGNIARIDIDTNVTSWDDANRKVINKIRQLYPDFEWCKYDIRNNNPQYASDFSATIDNPQHDNFVDFVVVMYRVNPGWQKLPKQAMKENYGGWTGTTGAYSVFLTSSQIIGISQSLCNSRGGSTRFTMKVKAEGYTSPNGNGGILGGTFVHELAHSMYDCPHFGGANHVCGKKYYMSNAWGAMRGGDSPFETSNAWERWFLGWSEIETNGVSSDINTIADLQNSGIYTLRDFVTTGDAIRVRIPSSNNTFQSIWLENHKGISVFDNRKWETDGLGNILPTSPRGLVAYTEDISRSRTFDKVFTKANGIKLIDKNGNFDIKRDGTQQKTADDKNKLNYWCNRFYNYNKTAPNPMSGQNTLSHIRDNYNDFPPNGAFESPGNCNSYTTSNLMDNEIKYNHNSNRGNGNEQFALIMVDGTINFDYMGNDNNIKLNIGNVFNIGTNPPLINIPDFTGYVPISNGVIGEPVDSDDPLHDTNIDYLLIDSIHPTVLNGIQIEVLNYSSNGDVTVKISLNKVDIENDIRWAGNIETSKVENAPNNWDLNIKEGKTILINRTETPNRITQNTDGKFTNFSYFTIKENTNVHLEKNAKITLDEGSVMRIKSSSLLFLEENAILEIKGGSKLIIDDYSNLILSDNATIIIESGSELHYNNSDFDSGIELGSDNINLAEINIKGKLLVADNCPFKLRGYGILNFNDDSEVKFGLNSGLFVEGKNNNDLLLKVGKNVEIELDANNLILRNGIVEMNDNSKFDLKNNEVEIHSVSFIGTNSSEGILSINSKISLDNSMFDNFNNAVRIINLNAVKKTFFKENFFYNIKESALKMDNSHDIGYLGLISNSFINCNKSISLKNISIVDFDRLIINSANEFGLELQNIKGSHFNNECLIENCNIGIMGNQSNVFLRDKSVIKGNNYGVILNGAPSDKAMLTVGDRNCGWIIENKKIAVSGVDLLLNIDAYVNYDNAGLQDYPQWHNRFDGNNINGGLVFDICYNLTSPKRILAKGNYWGNSILNNNDFKISRSCIIINNSQRIMVDASRHLRCKPLNCFNCPSDDESEESDDFFSGRIKCDNFVQNENISISEKFKNGEIHYLNESYSNSLQEFKRVSEVPIQANNFNIPYLLCDHLIRVAEVMVRVNKAQLYQDSLNNSFSSARKFISEEIEPNEYINENAQKLNKIQSIDIFPNPFNDKLTINYYTEIESDLVIEITDIHGKLIKKSSLKNQPIGENSIEISDISTAANQLYIIKILLNNEQKIVKLHKVSN